MMTKKAQKESGGRGRAEAPEAADARQEDDVQERETGQERAPEDRTAGDVAEEVGAEEIGAPATEEAPPIDDIVPGLDEVLGEGAAGNSAARIAELEAEKAEQKDQLLRALAELENTRRRAERDRRDAETYGGTRLARDLLAVYDNLNRALGAADDELRAAHGAFLEGVELTRRELLGAFSRHGIEKVSPRKGDRFDPHLHQAMFEAPVPGARDGTVIEVMEDGFTIADRLLRPARVGVARGGEAAGAEGAAGGGAKD